MTALDVFMYANQQVRTVIVDGEPWFVAADITSVLGYKNGRDAVSRHTKPEHRGVSRFTTPSAEQDFTVISEPAVFRLIMRSNTSEAIGFQEWLSETVLPSIRRTGQFGSALPANFAEALELAAVKVREIEALEAKVIADAPKVAAYDALMDADGYYSMEAVAKTLGMGRTTLYRRLRELGVIQAFSTMPYQRYMHHFVITVSTWTDGQGNMHPARTTRVRPSGLPFILSKLERVAA